MKLGTYAKKEKQKGKGWKEARKKRVVDRRSVREYVDLGQVVNRDSKSA